MKIAFISPLAESSGWGQAGRTWLLALDAAGADVAARPLLFAGQESLSGRVKELVSRDFGGADVIIQHVPPHLFVPTSNARNICLFVTEGSHLDNTDWPRFLNMADEVWVTCEHNKLACLNSGVHRPIEVIPHACDTSRYERSYVAPPPVQELKAEGRFVFYFIGEFQRRKRLDAVVSAYHSEFGPGEPVGLVIKTSRDGVPAAALHNDVSGYCRAAIEGTGLRKPLNPIVILTERLSEDALMGIHQASDCFVQVSYGEAWNQPAFDAMAMGKTPIVPRHSGHLEYLSDDSGYLVDCSLGVSHGLEETGWGSMIDVDVAHVSQRDLRRRMRQAFERGDEGRKARAGIERAYDFSFEEVGKRMIAVLRYPNERSLDQNVSQHPLEDAPGTRSAG